MKVINLFVIYKYIKQMKDFIFDADGVLLNSTKAVFEALIEAAKQLGLKAPTLAMIKALWGHEFENFLIPNLAEKLNWPLDKDREVIELFYELSYAQKYPLQIGLVDELKRMASRCRLGIVSNRDRASLERRFLEQKIDINIFAHIHTPEMGVRKPDPKVFDYFWNGAGFKPESTIFVGDSIEHDFIAAMSHHPPICFVAITSGLHSMAEFLLVGVKRTHIFKKVEDVFQAQYLIA